MPKQRDLRADGRISLATTSAAEADRLFTTLARGGHVQVGLCRTFFAARFGIVTDRFGVSWIITAPT